MKSHATSAATPNEPKNRDRSEIGKEAAIDA